MKLALRFLQLAALVATALASPAQAATEIMWWHAMSGELGKQLEKLAADFNASQSDYRVVPYVKRPGAPISTERLELLAYHGFDPALLHRPTGWWDSTGRRS